MSKIESTKNNPPSPRRGVGGEAFGGETSLASHGIKPTAMRLLVYDELERARRPLSLRELEERMVTAERSTIFRTLTLFLDRHIVHGIEDGSGTLLYELCRGEDECTPEDHHPHFYCERCQRTFCLDDVHIPQVPLPEGFTPLSINYMIHGLCPDCLRRS
ncbi:MAG: transcriptional repressor [Bacteroidaceae bacterium]|nr:transcriptional repressor [Bacteroidaceae bacterium]